MIFWVILSAFNVPAQLQILENNRTESKPNGNYGSQIVCTMAHCMAFHDQQVSVDYEDSDPKFKWVSEV